MEVCRKRKKSFFVLFVDLVKASDQVIRELVFGIPPGVTNVSKHLRDLELTETQLNFCGFIESHGSLFKVMGVHPRVVQLVCNLHASSWVTYGSLESAVIVSWRKTGMCLREYGVQRTHWPSWHLSDEVLSRGIAMYIHDSSNSTEQRNGSRERVQNVLDVTFADDECIMLAAEDPKSLASAIDCCILVLSTTFQLYKLEVNWRTGKTECLVQMVGKLGRVIV